MPNPNPSHPIERAILALTDDHSGALLDRSIANELRMMEKAVLPTRHVGTSRLAIIANCIDEALLALAEIEHVPGA